MAGRFPAQLRCRFSFVTHDSCPGALRQALEGHARWTEITDERSKALGKSQGKEHTERKIVTRSSMRSGLSGMSSDSRPHTRGTELSATFAEEVRPLLWARCAANAAAAKQGCYGCSVQSVLGPKNNIPRCLCIQAPRSCGWRGQYTDWAVY